jgi:hypothetical protein
MLKSTKIILAIVMFSFLIAATFFLVKSPISKGQTEKTEAKNNSSVKFPVVDFSQTELLNDSEERKAKNTYFDKNGPEIHEITETKIITEAESWIETLPAIPVSQSDIVLKGTISDSRAYVSANKTNIYSEFDVSVKKLLLVKEKGAARATENISINRVGGSLRFSSGHVQTYMLSGEGCPESGKTYVFFLKRNDTLKGFLLLTAYEVTDEKVYPVDNIPSQLDYRGKTLIQFLNEINGAL